MRYFAYNELGVDDPIIISEEEILKSYFPYWESHMRAKNKGEFATPENCIDEWLVVNWAWEVPGPQSTEQS